MLNVRIHRGSGIGLGGRSCKPYLQQSQFFIAHAPTILGISLVHLRLKLGRCKRFPWFHFGIVCFHELGFSLLWIARSDSPAHAVRMPITILIVDDEHGIRKLIRFVLKGWVDAVFLEANDAAEGLKIATQHRGPLDLLISDVVMPGRMNGIEMAAQLSQARQGMKVILMSGYAPEALTMEPDWHFIQKPFAVSEILERIGSILTDHWVAV